MTALLLWTGLDYRLDQSAPEATSAWQSSVPVLASWLLFLAAYLVGDIVGKWSYDIAGRVSGQYKFLKSKEAIDDIRSKLKIGDTESIVDFLEQAYAVSFRNLSPEDFTRVWVSSKHSVLQQNLELWQFLRGIEAQINLRLCNWLPLLLLTFACWTTPVAHIPLAAKVAMALFAIAWTYRIFTMKDLRLQELAHILQFCYLIRAPEPQDKPK